MTIQFIPLYAQYFLKWIGILANHKSCLQIPNLAHCLDVPLGIGWLN
ncbi:MAG: hypothetical protein WC380_00195 [Pedobacter sp.]